METMVVATRTLCLATRAKRGGTDEIRITRLLLLHAMTSRELWTFRGLDSCFRSNMDVVHGRWRNAFDTVMDFFGMIEVVDGRRRSGDAQQSNWEDWISGQSRYVPLHGGVGNGKLYS